MHTVKRYSTKSMIYLAKHAKLLLKNVLNSTLCGPGRISDATEMIKVL